MVNTTVANIVCPAISTEHPHGGLGQHVLQPQNFSDLLGFAFFGLQKWPQFVREALADDTILRELQPLFEEAAQSDAHGFACTGQACLHTISQLFSALPYTHQLSKTVFGIVFEERVAPSCALAGGLVLGIWNPASSSTPNAAASSSIGNDESLAEHLCYEFGIRGLATALACTREFQQRVLELRAFESVGIKAIATARHGQGVVPV
mmetsp:Transcript_79755/g.140766  ORF Transcript_79755/g.140766 Transcript_79755/m.140766 type:complete len:207 (+) Transcript_79755:2684-3304(+)